MLTIHINPYFVIFNVIFTHTTKQFVYLERSCWDTVHATVFSGRRSTPDQRRRLRKLFYYTYVSFVYNGEQIDAAKFNTEIDDIKYNVNHTRNEEQPGSTVLSNETLIPVEGYINPELKIEDKEVRQVVEKYRELTESKDYREEISLFLNTLIATCDDYKTLIDYIGFGRCITILRNMIFEQTFRISNNSEKILLSLFISKGDIELRFVSVLNIGDEKRINYDTICSDCMNVGCHYDQRHIRRGSVITDTRTCAPFSVKWFNRDGFLDLHYGVEDIIDRSDNTPYHLKYITDGRINGYAHWDGFRYGDMELDRYSDPLDVVSLVIWRKYARSLLRARFNDFDSVGSSLNHLFNTQASILEYDKAIKAYENKLLLSNVYELKECKELSDCYGLIESLYLKYNKTVTGGFGFNSVATNSTQSPFNDNKLNDPFGSFMSRNLVKR